MLTHDGVSVSPRPLRISSARPSRQTETRLFVVPRSMPTIIEAPVQCNEYHACIPLEVSGRRGHARRHVRNSLPSKLDHRAIVTDVAATPQDSSLPVTRPPRTP